MFECAVVCYKYELLLQQAICAAPFRNRYDAGFGISFSSSIHPEVLMGNVVAHVETWNPLFPLRVTYEAYPPDPPRVLSGPSAKKTGKGINMNLRLLFHFGIGFFHHQILKCLRTGQKNLEKKHRRREDGNLPVEKKFTLGFLHGDPF